MFDSPTLEYQAVEYANNATRPQWVKKKLQLSKRDDGYGVTGTKILVKIHAAGLNPVDSMLYNSYSKLLGWLFGPSGFGCDYSGTVVSIGEDAAKKTDLAVGDKVSGTYSHPFGAGSVAEYLLVDSNADPGITRAPKSIDFAEASAWPIVYGTAVLLIEDAGIKKGDKVLVLGGATSVGRLLLQMMKKYAEPGKVVATCSSRSAQLVKDFGAHGVIDYALHKNLEAPVKAEAADQKFDAVLDCVGNDDLFGSMDKILKPNGFYITICGEKKYDYLSVSVTSGLVNLFYSFSRSFLSLVGYYKYNYKFFMLPPGSWIHKGAERMDEGLKLETDSVFEKQDFDNALDRLRSNKASGKIIVKIE